MKASMEGYDQGSSGLITAWRQSALPAASVGSTVVSVGSGVAWRIAQRAGSRMPSSDDSSST
eukprot:m.273075 g.273075  ORF g.273075 m.273075 type:complete len:62 (-) comp45189_c0_seq1:1476-1661(-)